MIRNPNFGKPGHKEEEERIRNSNQKGLLSEEVTTALIMLVLGTLMFAGGSYLDRNWISPYFHPTVGAPTLLPPPQSCQKALQEADRSVAEAEVMLVAEIEGRIAHHSWWAVQTTENDERVRASVERRVYWQKVLRAKRLVVPPDINLDQETGK